MPSRLELAHSTHSKMMVAPPRLNLRRAASYNSHDRGPLSSTSSRFNFNHLLFSPPPSPSLPALVPRPKRSPTRILASRPSRLVRRLVFLGGLLLVLYLAGLALRNRGAVPDLWPHFANVEFEMVGQDVLPDFPTTIMASDGKGHSRWTVSIPPNHDFPLSIEEYAQMSGQCREISARARDVHHAAPLSEQTILAYDAPDDYFVDVDVAEKTGLLHPVTRRSPASKDGHFVGLDGESVNAKPVCESSMTFVLESPDAGLGNAMMLLWTFFGLARSEGRAFFIDDSRWAFGAFTDIFEAPHMPTCRPPPRHHMVPCPFHAKHLVVSSTTAKEVFPALLAKRHRLSGSGDSLKDLMGLARTGYESLFKLNGEDQGYVDRRIVELKSKAKSDDTSADAPIMGLHIRRGDQHPLEYQYRETYIPAEVFHDAAQWHVDAHYNRSTVVKTDRPSVTVIASDDPTVHEEPNFAQAFMAQERIRLASKDAIHNEAGTDRHVLHQFVDETFGWEGGFFAPMFWNLGVERKNNAANAPDGVELDDANGEARFAAPPSEETLRLRSLIGRAYLMDLAVLAGVSDKVVCAVSAMGCRLLAVMMGWEAAVQDGRWVNVDGAYEWTGISW